jgi:hypothetical protein
MWLASEVINSFSKLVQLNDQRIDIPVELTPTARQDIDSTLKGDPQAQRLILQLRNVQYDEPVGITYLLFLNLPPDAGMLDHLHPNFVGTLGFFGRHAAGAHADHASDGLIEEYDVTRMIRRLNLDDGFVLTAVPSLPALPPDRKDLRELISQMKPKGNPRFGEVVLLRVQAEKGTQ